MVNPIHVDETGDELDCTIILYNIMTTVKKWSTTIQNVGWWGNDK